MNSGSSPCAPRYLELAVAAALAATALRGRQPVALAAADAGRGGHVGAGDLGDHPLDRPAGRELDDGEADQHDPEQGRDDQEDALQKIGCHRRDCLRLAVSWTSSFAAFSASYHQVCDNAALVARLHGRPAELVPVGDVVGRLVPLRHPVVAGAQHAVERTRGRLQLLAALGLQHLGDQRVDDGMADAGQVAAAVGLGGLAAPEAPQLHARASGAGL